MNNNTAKKPVVFVLMPFKGDNFINIFENGIRLACYEAGVHCIRVDKEIIFDKITEEIYNQIDRADILIADVTGLNPNVYYEIGFAHGLGKNVIFIKNAKDKSKFPFDTADFQHVIYTGSEHLKIELKRRISSFVQNPEQNIWKSDFHKRRLQRFIPVIYQGFTEASSSIERFIRESLLSDSKLCIKLMGMALHKSFPLVSSLVEDKYLVRKHEENPLLNIDLAVVSSSWLQRYDGLIHNDWMERLNRFETQYSDFAKKEQDNFTINLYRFHHLPYIHGILINENHLFLGSASWDRHNKLQVGGNAYEEYSGDTFIGDRKIQQFIGWFNYCVKEHAFFANNVCG